LLRRRERFGQRHLSGGDHLLVLKRLDDYKPFNI
jgi:hypothetical protein